MGRSQESIEQRRNHWREKSKKLYADPVWRANKLAKQKACREKRKEEINAKSRADYHANKKLRNQQRIEWGRANRERQRAISNKHYDANRAEYQERRISRNPSIGLARDLTAFRKGDITFDQVVERIGERIVRLNQRIEDYEAGNGANALRPASDRSDDSLRPPDNQRNENENGTIENG